MSLFSEQNRRLLNGLVNAKTSIEGKNGSVTTLGSSPTIEEIITGIETISSGGGSRDYLELLENGLRETATSAPFRHAFLVSNANDTFSNTATNGNSNMMWWTSDGAEYSGAAVLHTWDKSKDSDDGFGFGNRWVICSRSNENGYLHLPEDVIFCVIDDGCMNSNSCFKGKPYLQGVRSKSGKRTWAPNITGLNYAGFNLANALTLLEGFDFSGITTFGNGLQVSGLMKLKNISGIESMLTLSANHLDRGSLIALLNALKSVSASTSLIIGATNLSRLTEEDKAIATEKGWTLA